ncbi:hypothetical protein CF326_g7510 [Tilletia indica]|nr:hypothetical protein CF326_g7510 [Tilletia indica]
MHFSLSPQPSSRPSRSSSSSSLLPSTTVLLTLATANLALFAQPASAGFDFKIVPDKCPKVNIQLTTGVLDGSSSATSFNLTIANLPPQGSFIAPPPFYSAQIALDNSALVFNQATDKGYFFNYSLGNQYANQNIRSVLVNATLLDLNNKPLKNLLGQLYQKKTLLDPLCNTSGTGNVLPTVSGIPGFINPTATSTSTPGSAGSDDSNSGESKGPDTKLIVGLVVGIVGGVLSLIVVGVVFWRKRQVKAGKRRELNPYAADHMGSGAREWKPVN